MTQRKNRVPIMLSDEELKRIDDWRFARRIGSRSDAVRQLIEAALFCAVPPTNYTMTTDYGRAHGSNLEQMATAIVGQPFDPWRGR